VCGERRFRAAGTAGLTDIPAVIRVLTDEEALELQIIENLQRKDVHPMEEAVAFKSLVDKGKDVQEIANRVGKKIYYVNQRLKLNQLTKEWQSVYFHSLVSLNDAMRLAVMPDKQQVDFYREQNMPMHIDRKVHISFSDYTFNKYRGNLSTATFDLTDITLNSKMGACTNCQYNSGAMALFPDAAKNPICTNITCFVHKTNFEFDRKLKAAKDDPSMVLDQQ
jgi:ParB family chromosome partitioning protein